VKPALLPDALSGEWAKSVLWYTALIGKSHPWVHIFSRLIVWNWFIISRNPEIFKPFPKQLFPIIGL
jgi:hypothetical protein